MVFIIILCLLSSNLDRVKNMYNLPCLHLTTKPKAFQNKLITVFLLCVMLVSGLQPKVHQLNYISFGLVMITLIVVWEGQKKNMHLIGQPCFHYGLCKQGQISFKLKWQHQSMLIFCSRKNQGVPLSIKLGTIHLHPQNQPSTCALQNFFSNGTFAHVYKPLDLDAWPKSRNGKKICCPSMFKLSILQENKWEVGRALKATLLTTLTIPLSRYGQIYRPLLRLLKN